MAAALTLSALSMLAHNLYELPLGPPISRTPVDRPAPTIGLRLGSQAIGPSASTLSMIDPRSERVQIGP